MTPLAWLYTAPNGEDKLVSIYREGLLVMDGWSEIPLYSATTSATSEINDLAKEVWMKIVDAANAEKSIIPVLSDAMISVARETSERIAKWINDQRADVPAHGWEFTNPIRFGEWFK